jgi:hypothetical protein
MGPRRARWRVAPSMMPVILHGPVKDDLRGNDWCAGGWRERDRGGTGPSAALASAQERFDHVTGSRGVGYRWGRGERAGGSRQLYRRPSCTTADTRLRTRQQVRSDNRSRALRADNLRAVHNSSDRPAQDSRQQVTSPSNQQVTSPPDTRLRALAGRHKTADTKSRAFRADYRLRALRARDSRQQVTSPSSRQEVTSPSSRHSEGSTQQL